MSATHFDAMLVDSAFAAGATNVSIERVSVDGPRAFMAHVTSTKLDGPRFMYASALGHGATWAAALADALANANVASVKEIVEPQQRVAIGGATSSKPRQGWRERMRGGRR